MMMVLRMPGPGTGENLCLAAGDIRSINSCSRLSPHKSSFRLLFRTTANYIRNKTIPNWGIALKSQIAQTRVHVILLYGTGP